MDEGTVRRHAEGHIEMLRAGDLPGAFSDMSDEAKSQVEPYVLNFPSPVEEAKLVTIVFRPEGYVATVEISGGGRRLRLDTVWAETEDGPTITRVTGTGEG